MRVVYLKTTLKQKFPRFDTKMEQIGFGIQGVVYSDGEYAYKLCRYNTNYVRWLLNLRRNKLLDNPHVPEVYKIYVDKHKKHCLVQMELLSPGKERKMQKESYYLQCKINNFMCGKSKKTNLDNLDTVAKNVAEFIAKQERAGRPICLDMHFGNVMMRHKQLVITDPVV